jgi:hypothetical protein
MVKMTDTQLLYASTLVYLIDRPIEDFTTVQEVLNFQKENIANGNVPTTLEMKEEDWSQMISYMENDQHFAGLHLYRYVDFAEGPTMVTFLDDSVNPTDIVVSFRGTVTEWEWEDNNENNLRVTEDFDMSIDYVNNLPESFQNITVTGHSKGAWRAEGCMAEVDRVTKCTTFSAPGYAFPHRERFEEKLNRKENMENTLRIGNYYDCIQGLCTPLANTPVVFVTSDFEIPYVMYAHYPISMLDNNGQISERKSSTPHPFITSMMTFYEFLSQFPQFVEGYFPTIGMQTQVILTSPYSLDNYTNIWENTYQKKEVGEYVNTH